MANTFKFGNGNWAVKKDSVLAYNDENDNFKPLPFDFTRDSTATYVDSDGLIKTASNNEARIDYLDNANGHLLLEPSRTNLATYSEDFSNGAWIKYGTPTITINNVTSPDGTLTGTKVERGSNSVPLRESGITTLNTEYTFSIYAKKGNHDELRLDIGDEGEGTNDFILTDEWQRFEMTSTPDTYTHVDITLPNSSSGDYIYIWGAQVEAGSYATSYIPTNGETNGVTRAADSANQTAPDGVIGQTEGTIYVDVDVNESTGISTSLPIRFNLNNGISTENWVFIGIESGDNLRVYVRANASTSVDFTKNAVFPTSGNYKIAMSFKANKTVCYVNGVLQLDRDEGVVPNNLNSIGLGASITGSASSEKSQTKEIKVYNTALTDAELITLTT